MLNLIIAVDEKDAELGHYFESSKSQLHDNLTQNEDYQVQLVPAANCHQTYIDVLIENTQKPLVFVAYSHGTEKSLNCNNVAYLDGNTVTPLLNSFVYAMSCSNAATLGQCFEGQNGAFIGFDKKVKAFTGSDYIQKSINCDNSGILYVLNHADLPIKNAKAIMKNSYNNMIDHLVDMKERALYIDYIKKMRDSLKFIGNENLTINDLIQ